MLLERKQDLSVVYFVKDLLVAYPHIVVTDEFPLDDLVIPSIAVENRDIRARRFELGNKKFFKSRAWDLHVFAQNKSQRDDIGYTLLNAFEDCIPVNDYDEGFPPTVVTQLGCLNTESLDLEVIKVLPQLVEKLYYRAMVSFTASYSKF